MLKKNIHIWLPSYLKSVVKKLIKGKSRGPVHIMFCFVDHFEPVGSSESDEEANKIVEAWCKQYPELMQHFEDSDGYHPKHTFFYPQEEYRENHLTSLAELCQEGWGEVEVHLHHDNDTGENLKNKLIEFVDILATKHHLLSVNKDNQKIMYGFIHGNWALDNSGEDGKMCGVDDELTILRDTGCYADFTFPSAPHNTQTLKINSIYYAVDDPKKPKSHDTGLDVSVKIKVSGDLVLIQGPLTLNWKNRKWCIFPRIENADIAYDNIPTKTRIDLWIKQHIHVKGKEDWLFVKVHTHGAQKKNIDLLLGSAIKEMHQYLNNVYNDEENYFLHYVTAREMYNIVKAAEAGMSGNPNHYRDYILVKR